MPAARSAQAATGAITIAADNDGSGAGTLTTSAAIGNASATGAITLSGADIALGAAVTGTGALTVQPSTASSSIGIGGGAGTFALSTAEVADFTNGFSSITIGRSDSSGAITISAVTFNDPVTIQSPSGSGTVTVNGAITGSGNACSSRNRRHRRHADQSECGDHDGRKRHYPQ